jgi:hypothetical protein
MCHRVADEKQWAIQEASKTADGFDFAEYILPHCTNEELESVVKQQVGRRRWYAVGMVLKRGTPAEIQKQVIESSVQNIKENDLTNYIIPFCASSQYELILTHLAARGLWDAIGLVLQQKVSGQRGVQAKKACNEHDMDTYSRYTIHDTLLTHLIRCGYWSCVHLVLETCTNTAGLSQREYRNHTPGQNLYELVEHLALKKYWSAVGEILKVITIFPAIQHQI